MQIKPQIFFLETQRGDSTVAPEAECLFECASFQSGTGTSDNPAERGETLAEVDGGGVCSENIGRSKINRSLKV